MLKKVCLIALLALAGCMNNSSSDRDPKQRLKDYISVSFSVSNDETRKTLLGFLTGDAKNRLAAWSDEQFHKAFVETKRQFVKLVFRDVKNVSPEEVHIVYELTYLDQGKGVDAKVTNKKLCQLVKESGNWFIKDVHSMKELVEYQNELSLP